MISTSGCARSQSAVPAADRSASTSTWQRSKKVSSRRRLEQVSEGERRRWGADFEGRDIRPEPLCELAPVNLVRPVPLELHLAHFSHQGRQEPNRREQPEWRGGDPQSHAERLGAQLQNLSGRSDRRAGCMPSLPKGFVRRVEQRDYSARNIGHVCEIVRHVGWRD